jgi:hypothetical protein
MKTEDMILVPREVSKGKLPKEAKEYLVFDPNGFMNCNEVLARFSKHNNEWFVDADMIHPTIWYEPMPLLAYLEEKVEFKNKWIPEKIVLEALDKKDEEIFHLKQDIIRMNDELQILKST